MYYIGIDPGYTGAIAIISKNTVIDVIDMPLTIIKKGTKKIVNLKRVDEVKKRIDGKFLYNFLKKYKKVFVTIEHAQSMPDQGEVSIFNYAEGYGRVLGVLDSLGIDFHEVNSSVWKNKMKLNDDKKLSISKCLEYFPDSKSYVNLVKYHGRAEALLLAKYGIDYVCCKEN